MKSHAASSRRILAVKLAGLGDLLLTEPALRSLRTAFPTACLDLLTTPQAAGLLSLLDHGFNAIVFDKHAYDAPARLGAGPALAAGRLGTRLRGAGYDMVVLFHHLTTSWGAAKYRALSAAAGAPMVVGLDNGRGSFLTDRVIDRGFGARHETDYMLAVALAAGGAPVDPRPRIDLSRADPPANLPGRFVAVAPVTGEFSGARAWPLERFVDISLRLARDGCGVVIVGGSDARDAGAAIAAVLRESALDLTGRTSIDELAGALQRATLFIGCDSFPAHLAAAVGTPTLTIFGPSNSRAWAPRAERGGLVLSAALPCSPCLYTGYELGRREGCPCRTCLTSIEPDEVYRAAMELLDA